MEPMDVLSPLRWKGDALELLDQTRLPREETWISCRDYRAVARAIKEMVVRGAPAIGCAAAYGVALGVAQGEPMDKIVAHLRSTRPTAVNLFWALDRMSKVQPHTADAMAKEAVAI